MQGLLDAWRVQPFLDGVEVVAKGGSRAILADVIDVHLLCTGKIYGKGEESTSKKQEQALTTVRALLE